MRELITGLVLIGIFFFLVLFLKSGYDRKKEDEAKKKLKK